MKCKSTEVGSLEPLKVIRNLHLKTCQDLNLPKEATADIEALLEQLQQLLTGISLMQARGVAGASKLCGDRPRPIPPRSWRRSARRATAAPPPNRRRRSRCPAFRSPTGAHPAHQGQPGVLRRAHGALRPAPLRPAPRRSTADPASCRRCRPPPAASLTPAPPCYTRRRPASSPRTSRPRASLPGSTTRSAASASSPPCAAHRATPAPVARHSSPPAMRDSIPLASRLRTTMATATSSPRRIPSSRRCSARPAVRSTPASGGFAALTPPPQPPPPQPTPCRRRRRPPASQACARSRSSLASSPAPRPPAPSPPSAAAGPTSPPPSSAAPSA